MPESKSGIFYICLSMLSQANIPSGFHGTVKWQSPSNIALVKYWGKKGVQLPQNPSISFTLSNCRTETEISFDVSGRFSLRLLFEGK